MAWLRVNDAAVPCADRLRLLSVPELRLLFRGYTGSGGLDRIWLDLLRLEEVLEVHPQRARVGLGALLTKVVPKGVDAPLTVLVDRLEAELAELQ